MVSKAKLYTQLDSLEDELRDRIVPHLENAVNDRNDLIFCTTDFNPFPELKSKTDKETGELIQLGRQVLVLREKLGEPSAGCIAEKICWYCRKWGDVYDSHRKPVQGLAQAFLQEIVNTKA
jgi:hypothetical protein